MNVDLKDVMDAIEEVNEDEVFYFNTKTSEIIYDQDYDFEEDNEDDFIALPSKQDRGDYDMMVKFIGRVEDDTAVNWLENAITGKGAFRRFRACCEKFHLLEDWYDFKDRCLKDLAINWCEENGIVWQDNEREEEMDEDNVSDFYHEQYEEPIESEPVQKKNTDESIRIVRLTKQNYENAMYIMDACLKKLQHRESDLEASLDQTLQYIEDGYTMYVASNHGRYVGVVIGYVDQSTYRCKAIYVLPDYRKQGIGRQLFQQIEEDDSSLQDFEFSFSTRSTDIYGFLQCLDYIVQENVTMKKTLK